MPQRNRNNIPDLLREMPVKVSAKSSKDLPLNDNGQEYALLRLNKLHSRFVFTQATGST